MRHPVGLDRLHQAKATALQEISGILDRSTRKWTFAAQRLKVTISAVIHALVGRHAQPDDLIRLADGEHGHPAEMHQRIAHDERHPRIQLSRMDEE